MLRAIKTSTLPQSGKNAIRFNSQGEITTTRINTTKAADFLIDGVYYSQKYTEREGGAQDNQKDDVIRFLDYGSKKHKVGAIINGSYWKKHRKEIEEYFSNNRNVVITSMEEMVNDRKKRH